MFENERENALASHGHPAGPPRRALCDQIPRERLAVLGAALARWTARDDSKAEPAVRRAANTAMDEIDAMLRELHALQAALVTEIRASDDASAARADALLARRMTRKQAAGITDTGDPGARALR